MENVERLEVLLMNLVDYLDEILGFEDGEEFNDFLLYDMGFLKEDVEKYSPYPMDE